MTIHRAAQRPFGTIPDILSAILLVTLLVGLLLQPVHAVISDFWYHLATARALITNGAIPFHDWWDFQPLGRPHFYPPLIHLLISIFAWCTAAFTKQDIFSVLLPAAYRLGSLLYVASLGTAWYLYRHFWGAAGALLGLSLLAINLIFTLAATSLMPAALISLFLPLFLVALHKQRCTVASVLLAFSFYAHATLPWLMLLSLALFWYRSAPESRSFFLRVGFFGVLPALPWILYSVYSILTLNLSHIFSDNPLPGVGPFAFLSHYALNIVFYTAVVIALIKTRQRNDEGLKLIRTMCIAFLPMLLFYGGRYFWHLTPLFGAFIVSWLRPHLDIFFQKLSVQKVFGVVAVSVFLLVPTLQLSANAHTSNVSLQPEWTAFDLIFIPTENETDSNSFQETAAFISDSVPPDRILNVDIPELAEMLFVTTGRTTDNGQFWESSGTSPTEIRSIASDTDLYGAFIRTPESKTPLPPVDIVQNIGDYTVGIPHPPLLR